MNKYSLLCAFILFSSCTKPLKMDEAPVNLTIIKTETPLTQTQGKDIVSQVTCSGANLCYHFTNFQVNETGQREYEIYAMGTVPNHLTECAQTIYYKDTTVKINAAVKGQYLLHFFNYNALFKTDTVQVN
jgi:hypothetical protein